MIFTFSSIAEQSMDMLFLEEFIESPDFAQIFFSKIDPNCSDFNRYKVESVHQSLTDPQLGESDMTVIFEGPERKKLALLIEDKIDAIAQPEQYERYHKRGEKWKANNENNQYYVFLIAPQKYIDKHASIDGYDYTVSYEECLDYLKQKSGERYLFKQEMLHRAISEGGSGYSKRKDDIATQFWKEFRALKESISMTPVLPDRYTDEKSYQGDWPSYRSSYISVPKGRVYIQHKMDRGLIDLTFVSTGKLYSEFEQIIRPSLDAFRVDYPGFNISICKTENGNSIVVRRKVIPLNFQKPMSQQVIAVHESIHSLMIIDQLTKYLDQERIIDFYKNH